MASPYQVFVFGDMNYDFEPSLTVLCELQDNAQVTSFFERTAFALRARIGGLPLAKRASFPKFTTLTELIAKVRSTDAVHPALQKALILVLQFGFFIRYAHSPYSILFGLPPRWRSANVYFPSHFTQAGHVFPTHADTCLTGLCTGLLTAVTVSCCSSLPELIPVAVDSVVLAFRAGLLVEDVRMGIEPSVTKRDSWSVVVPGLKEHVAADALKNYIFEKVLSGSLLRKQRAVKK